MSKSTAGLRRAGIASTATTALVMGAAITGAGVASADADFTFTRVQGQDRYETSAQIADRFGAATDAILASGEPGHYPDALTANYLAGTVKAPVLLTRRDTTPPSILQQLKDNGVKTVHIVGGELAVSAAQEAALTAEGFTVVRHAGRTRFDTNTEVIEAGPAKAPSDTALIATGLNFPDALAAGPLAYKGGHPIGISNGADMPDHIIDALKAVGVSKALVVGGPLSVPESVVSELNAKGITVVQRLARTTAGQTNRSGTAAAVAEYAVANLKFSDAGVNVASGRPAGDGADALSGGPLSGQQNRPILITENENSAGSATLGYLKAHACTLTDGIIFGGSLAISAATETAMQAAARDCGTNQDFTVSQDAATNPFSTSGATTEDQGRRTYSFSGLDDTKTYDVAVYPAEYVTVDSSGAATFRDTEGTTATTDDNNVADFAATSAVIERINNAAYTDAPTNGTALDVAPLNGVITVTLDSAAVDQVRPVLFLDADNGSAETLPDLDLDAKNQPTELFAVGGQKNWVAPTAASSADAADGRVASLDKTANRFSVDTGVGTAGDYDAAAADVTYLYDGNDSFKIVGVPATLEEFEAQLSRGDFVTVGNYSTNSALVSQFDISTDTPAAPTSVTATAGTTGQSTNDITVVIDPSTPNDPELYDSFVIQRAAVVGGTPGTFTTVKTLVPADDADTSTTTITWVDNNVAAGIYQYRAAGVIDGDQGAFTNSAPVTSVTPGPDTTGPLSDDAVVTTNSGLGGTFDAGDVFKVVFNETMAAPTAGDLIRAQDADATPTVADFVNGTNATFSLNSAAETVNGTSRPAGTVLTVTLTGAPTIVTAGTTTGLQIPATVTDQSGNTDTAGNGWNIAGSADKILDQDAVDNTP